MEPTSGTGTRRRRTLWAADLGRQPYPLVWGLQQTLAEERRRMRVPDVLLFTEHPAVFTLGRRGDAGNLIVPPSFLAERGIRCLHTDRGGDVTYHGPGQVVGYPVLRVAGGSRRVRQYVGDLEEAILRALERFGIRGERVPGQPGVWAGGGKIAFIGLAVQRDVCFHGFSLNLAPDLTPFSWMHPCGLRDVRVTSMQALLGDPPARREVVRALADTFAERLGYGPRWVSPAALPGGASLSARDR